MSLPSYVGRYAIRHEIARGGFAIVVLAWDEELDSAVALKILEPSRGDAGDELQARFIKEARLLRRIRSHHVVTVHDIGRLNDGRPYFVMDLADRGTLADWLDNRRGERPSGKPTIMTREIVAFADALSGGLGAIHKAGVIHRDIKPANILFQSVRLVSADPLATVIHPASGGPPLPSPDASLFEDTRILVGDLGIAKDVDRGGVTATLLGGTPAYQAPEQLDQEQPVTAAADIYSATAVLYHLIVGARPPQPDRLDENLSRIPEQWQDVIRSGLALKPDERFASIEGWHAAVHDILAAEAAESTSGPTTAILSQSVTAVSSACPYKGLGAYQPEDTGKFFGREALTEDIVHRIQTRHVLVVGGPSGSGKSSLVRAGLIPALRAGALANSADWRIALMTPGRDAMAELCFQLSHSLGSGSPAIGANDLAARPALARRLAHPTGSEAPLVLVVDQFEELFTLCPPAQRDTFVDALSSMTDPADSLVRVVLAVRADYYAVCAQIPWLAERITDNQVLVGPMSPTELRRAISEPARQAGLYLERNLVDAVIEDAGNEAGSLPLLAHALVETWARRKGATLTLEGYRAAGGVTGAIAQTAEAIFENRFSSAEQDATRRLFLRLVTPGEGAGDTRRIVERAEIEADSTPQLTARVVEQMAQARLLTLDKRDVQIAHEALLRSWPRLRRWIDEARDDLRTRQRLIRHADEWEASNRDPDLLLRGTSLLSAIDWRAKNPDQGGALAQSFIEASVEAKERTEAAANESRARARRLRTAAVSALSVLAVGATVASIFAFLGYRDAQRNELVAAAATRQANARFATALGAVGAGLAQDDPRLALYLAGEAMAGDDVDAPGFDARAAMIAAREQLAGNGPHLLGSPIPVGDALSLAIDAEKGKYVAIGGRDGSITVLDTHTRQSVGAPLTGHQGGVEDLKFAPGGRSLASAGDDGTVRLWSLEDGFIRAGPTIAHLGGVVWSVAFDPLGDQLATVSGDQTVRLWDTRTGSQIGLPIIEGIRDPLSIAFSPDGRGLIAGTGDGAIHGWRLPGREMLMPPIVDVHSSDIWSLLFAPAGDRFATVSSDGTSALFNYPAARYDGRAFQSGNLIQSAAFTHDGASLIGGGEDGRLHIWNLASGTAAAPSAVAHTGRISDVALSGDGHMLASLGRDQTVRLWTLFDPVPTALDRRVATGAAKGVAISGDGAFVAAGEESGIVYLWKSSDQSSRTFVGHAHPVWALAFSPDGRSLASGDRSGEVRVWDVESGALRRVQADRNGAVWWLGFTPDGQRLIEASDSGVDVFDAASGDRVAAFQQDSGQVTRAALSPDGALIAATTTDGRVRLYNLTDQTLARDLHVLDDMVWSAAFSPDGRSLAVASSDEVVSLWDVATGERRADLAGHTGGATDVTYLADGVTLAVVDRRGSLHFWDLVGERRLSAPIAAHASASWRLAVAPRTEVFLTSGDDGKIRSWDILSIARACEIGAPAFDRARQREYFGETQHARACTGRLANQPSPERD